MSFSADARRILILLFLAAALLAAAGHSSAAETRRITVLYDAFGPPSDLERDWGYGALVEYGGRRILFDTGNDSAIFERNVKALGVDLARLDAVVISHRHGDHTGGLNYLLRVNPKVKIYAPQEMAFFKSRIQLESLQRVPSLPESLRYYGGETPEKSFSGTPWEAANFQVLAQTTEIFPDFHAISTRSEKRGTLEMNELSLAIRTPKGLAVIVGCSHPGVENILRAAAAIEPKLYTVTGGFHLIGNQASEVDRVAAILHDELEVERVAPGHCTSEPGFATFLKRFGKRFDQSGVGTVLALP